MDQEFSGREFLSQNKFLAVPLLCSLSCEDQCQNCTKTLLCSIMALEAATDSKDTACIALKYVSIVTHLQSYPKGCVANKWQMQLTTVFFFVCVYGS